jgi:hypothetical protein
MKIMTSHSSATTREQTPHVNRTTRTATIINALKRRAEDVLNDTSIDPESRAIIRYALETNDPWLAKLVRRADAGETIVFADGFSRTSETNTRDSSEEEKIQALAEIICRAGDQFSAALLVLMSTLEKAAHPTTLANRVKNFAFAFCGDLKLSDMIDAQVAVLERELFAGVAVYDKQ